MATNAVHRVYMANVGYNVQKGEIRQVLEELGVFSCVKIQVTRVDQVWIPEHCTYFLDLTDVSEMYWKRFQRVSVWNHFFLGASTNMAFFG